MVLGMSHTCLGKFFQSEVNGVVELGSSLAISGIETTQKFSHALQRTVAGNGCHVWQLMRWLAGGQHQYLKIADRGGWRYQGNHRQTSMAATELGRTEVWSRQHMGPQVLSKPREEGPMFFSLKLQEKMPTNQVITGQ